MSFQAGDKRAVSSYQLTEIITQKKDHFSSLIQVVYAYICVFLENSLQRDLHLFFIWQSLVSFNSGV